MSTLTEIRMADDEVPKRRTLGAQSLGDRIFDLINYTALTVVGAVSLYPLLYLFVIGFNSGTDTLRGGLFLWPRVFTLANFAAILSDPIVLSAYRVTILRAGIGTLLAVFVTALVAYGLSERRLPFRNLILVYMLIPMVFHAGLIPVYLNLRTLGLIDTFWVYILPGIFNVWNFLVMKTFFQQIPEELKESMRIDGANELLILFRLILPISKPVLAAIALFVAVGHWNDWFTGAFFVNDQDLIPMQTYLHMVMSRNMSEFVGQDMSQRMTSTLSVGASLLDYSTVNSLSLKVAAVLVGTIPILLVYPFLQKYFVKGIRLGSIKQ